MKTLSVWELNKLIEREIALQPRLQRIEVEAEMSRLTKHRSGHYYFTIKDDHASIDCVMFKSSITKKASMIEEGDRVILRGKVSVYNVNARLQFIVQSMEKVGQSDAYLEFLELQRKFQEEGLFDVKTSDEIPSLPDRIAIITSPTSAAYSDYKKVLRRRNPFVQVDIFPSLMQSADALPELNRALDQAQGYDLIVITRGGGSYEDLRVFNDPELALHVLKIETPVIAAIGHEIDYTLIELVSSLRAATPSEAAERSSMDVYEWFYQNVKYLAREKSRILKEMNHRKLWLDDLFKNMRFRIEHQIASTTQTIYGHYQQIQRIMENKVQVEKTNLLHIQQMLTQKNPQHILEQGYSISRILGKPIDATNAQLHQKMITITKDLRIESIIEDIKERA